MFQCINTFTIRDADCMSFRATSNLHINVLVCLYDDIQNIAFCDTVSSKVLEELLFLSEPSKLQ